MEDQPDNLRRQNAQRLTDELHGNIFRGGTRTPRKVTQVNGGLGK